MEDFKLLGGMVLLDIPATPADDFALSTDPAKVTAFTVKKVGSAIDLAVPYSVGDTVFVHDSACRFVTISGFDGFLVKPNDIIGIIEKPEPEPEPEPTRADIPVVRLDGIWKTMVSGSFFGEKKVLFSARITGCSLDSGWFRTLKEAQDEAISDYKWAHCIGSVDMKILSVSWYQS